MIIKVYTWLKTVVLHYKQVHHYRRSWLLKSGDTDLLCLTGDMTLLWCWPCGEQKFVLITSLSVACFQKRKTMEMQHRGMQNRVLCEWTISVLECRWTVRVLYGHPLDLDYFQQVNFLFFFDICLHLPAMCFSPHGELCLNKMRKIQRFSFDSLFTFAALPNE